jgi:hypothetical protein
VPVEQHLQEVNTPGTLAHANARGEALPPTDEDDTPDAPLDIRYGKARLPPGRVRAGEEVPEQAAIEDDLPPSARSPDFQHLGWATRNARLGDEFKAAQTALREAEAPLRAARERAGTQLPPGYKTIPYPNAFGPGQDGVALQDEEGNDIAFPLTPAEAAERAWRDSGREDRYAEIDAIEQQDAARLEGLRADVRRAREAWDANGDSPMAPTWAAEREARMEADEKRRVSAAKAANTRARKKRGDVLTSVDPATTPDPRSPAQRQLAPELSRENGRDDARANGLHEAVSAALGNTQVPVRYLRGTDGLRGLVKEGTIARLQDQQRGRGEGQRTSGLYVPASQSADGKPFAVVFTDAVSEPALAAFTAAHEIAGHHGLRSLLGDKLDPALDIALQNPTVKAVADAVGRQRKLRPHQRLLAVEEALADLSAALRTNDWARIQSKHGVAVPPTLRSRLRAAIDNFLRRLAKLFGAKAGFSDGQVRALLEDAGRAADGQTGGEAAEQVDGQQANIDDALQEAGITIPDKIAAEKLWDDGNHRIFGVHEQAEGEPVEITSFDMLRRWDPEALMALPRSVAKEYGITEPEALESVDDSQHGFTPEQREFMRKAGMGNVVDTRTTLQRVTDWALGKKLDFDGDSLIQSGLDQFHGIKRARDEKGGIVAESDPYLAARQINTGSTMEAILLYGAPELRDGALRVNRNVPGLLQALGPVSKDMPRFLGWLVARRAKALKAQGRENLMTDEDIAAGLALAKGSEDAFTQAAGDYLRLKNAILDLAEQAGELDPAARAMWDSAEYVPFYRETEGGAAGPGTRQGLANQSAGIRKLKGGESALKDPLANIIQNFTRLVDSAMKNRATLLAVDTLGEPYVRKAAMTVKPEVIPLAQVKKHLVDTGTDPAAVDALPRAALEGVAKMLAIKAPEGEDIVRVMRGGKAEYYHVDDPLLLRSLTAFNEVPTHPFVKPMVWAKQMLTAGATATPEFMVANLLRDTGEAAATAQHRFIPLVDTLRGAVERIRESELTQDLMMAGSAFHSGYFHTGNNEDTAKAIRRALRKEGMAQGAIEKHLSTLYNPVRWWDLYRTAMEASEMGSRVMLAQRTLEAGGSFLEGAHEAKDFLDFSMRGDDRFVQFFTNVLPFLNARLQGGYRLARVGTTKGRRGRMAARMAMIALATTSLYAWNVLLYGDAYDELEDWDKDTYWHIAPGTKYHTRIPKPFEIGLVAGTGVERLYAALAYQLTDGEKGDRPRRTWEAFVRGITGTLAINPIPQLLRPAAEVKANRDFYFDSPIENMGDKFKAPEDRHTATTSLSARHASHAMTWLLGDDLALSPKQLQHLWRGYTGGMGTYLLDSTDWVLRHAEGEPERPEMALRDFPLAGRFARGSTEPYATRYTDEFYDLRDKAQMQSDRIKQAVEDGEFGRARNLESEWGWLLGERQDSKRAKAGFMHAGVRTLNAEGKRLSALRREDQATYESRTMTPAEKRAALDATAKERNALVRKAVRRLNEAERTRGG